MAVIRKKHVYRSIEPSLFQMPDPEEQAKRTVEAARVEAQTVTAAARADGFEEGKREGYEAGLREGHAAGMETALAEHSAGLIGAAEALKQAAGRFEEARSQFTREALVDCVELALAVAKRVTKRQSLVDPQVLSANLEQAMKMVIGCTRLRIALHPDDRATITQALEKLRFSNAAVETAQIVDDPGVARGGCRIETEHGTVDADIDAQLNRLIDQLMPITPQPESPK